MPLDVHIFSGNVGSVVGTTVWPMFKVPSGFGGISIQGAELTPGGAVSGASLHLVTLGTSGTAADGTITTTALGLVAQRVPQAFAITNAFVPEGKYVGVQNAGTATNTITQISVSYVVGRKY